MNQVELFKKAERQRAMADAIMGRAMQSRVPQQQGRITPKLGIGEGVTQLGEALLGRVAGKRADKTEASAEEQRRIEMAKAIGGMGGNFRTAQEAIEAGVHPAVVSQYMQEEPKERLVVINGPDGPQYVRESDAVGQSPYDKSSTQGGIGQYNPRDYTPESWAKFVQTKDVSVLKRYEPYSTLDLGGGRRGVLDRTTGQIVEEPVSADEFQTGVLDTKKAAAQGTGQGQAVTAAQERLAAVDTTAQQLETLLADPKFSAAVGPIDAVTGRIGEMFGSDEGVLGGEVQRVANQLVTDAVSSWKGAISERELDFFQNSVPGRGSSAATWRHWYQNEFLPRKRMAENIASGQAFQKSAPSQTSGNVGGITWTIEE